MMVLLLLSCSKELTTDSAVPDVDHDGWADEDDCAPEDPAVHPGMDEEPYNGIDDDCDEDTPDDDLDGDGFELDDDCDDEDAGIHPDAPEVCDGVDQDCDGEADDHTGLWYGDFDGDGYGDDTLTAFECETGMVTNASDCDDLDAAVHPGATEVCDDAGTDEDCDGLVDDDDPSVSTESMPSWYLDVDGDGYGQDASVAACGPTDVYSSDNDDDCDDLLAHVNPGADEICDDEDVDEDCDGLADDDDTDTVYDGEDGWYTDADSDGYGDPSSDPTVSCDASYSGTAQNDDDCDDTRADVNPGADEICDELDVDEDCDGLVDDQDDTPSGGTELYADDDGDGYGDAGDAQVLCDEGSGWVDDGTDCDDTDPSVNPGAVETWYDGTDADCLGDDDYDADADGYQHDGSGGDDCDDDDATVHPTATDSWYDGVDSDCDGASDYDADADGYDHAGYGGGDCDDHDLGVYPGAPEVDAGVDNDCDGFAEERPTAVADYDRASSLEECDTLTLDASGSSDPDGSVVAWDWEVLTVPAASARTTADLDSADEEQPTFAPDATGNYSFGLTVTDDGGAASAQDTMSVAILARARNAVPVADAGPNQASALASSCTVDGYGYDCADCSDASFTLAGSATDDDDAELSYAWSVTSGSSHASLTDPGDGSGTVTVGGVSATYGSTTTQAVVLQLTVTDCIGDTDTDTVTLTVQCTGS